jgi:hypothetical protein
MDTRLIAVAAMPVAVWIGLFIYMLMVDRRLARIEAAADTEQDDL